MGSARASQTFAYVRLFPTKMARLLGLPPTLAFSFTRLIFWDAPPGRGPLIPFSFRPARALQPVDYRVVARLWMVGECLARTETDR